MSLCTIVNIHFSISSGGFTLGSRVLWNEYCVCALHYTAQLQHMDYCSETNDSYANTLQWHE